MKLYLKTLEEREITLTNIIQINVVHNNYWIVFFESIIKNYDGKEISQKAKTTIYPDKFKEIKIYDK